MENRRAPGRGHRPSMAPRPARPGDGMCWITGASSGIGEALTRHLARQGWRVAISARSADKLNILAAEFPDQVFVFPVDITDAAAVEQTVSNIEDRHGSIARAVLNAGLYVSIDADVPQFEDYARTFDVNLKGATACLCALNPRMVARASGQIVIVSSATAFGGMPTATAYGATKAGLMNMAESLAIELHRHGVHDGRNGRAENHLQGANQWLNCTSGRASQRPFRQRHRNLCRSVLRHRRLPFGRA